MPWEWRYSSPWGALRQEKDHHREANLEEITKEGDSFRFSHGSRGGFHCRRGWITIDDFAKTLENRSCRERIFIALCGRVEVHDGTTCHVFRHQDDGVFERIINHLPRASTEREGRS
jgi:hypothetical protein